MVRFEPLTIGWWGECSTIKLLPMAFIWLPYWHFLFHCAHGEIRTIEHRMMRWMLYHCAYCSMAFIWLCFWHFHFHIARGEIQTLDFIKMRQVLYHCATAYSLCLTIFLTFFSFIVPVVGFEPLTIGWWGKCYTIELLPLALSNWMIEIFSLIVPAVRFETLTIGWWGECFTIKLLPLAFIWLPYWHFLFHCARSEIRTLDIRLMRQVLYHCATAYSLHLSFWHFSLSLCQW
jgi:hypothetical protein